MVEALLIHCLQSIGELGKSTVSIAWGSEMHLARVDCLLIVDNSLREPLGQRCLQ